MDAVCRRPDQVRHQQRPDELSQDGGGVVLQHILKSDEAGIPDNEAGLLAIKPAMKLAARSSWDPSLPMDLSSHLTLTFVRSTSMGYCPGPFTLSEVQISVNT